MDAFEKFRHETMKRLEPHKTHIQTLKSIHETETARAKELAEKYRVQQSKYSPNVTPISQPIQKMNLIQQQRSLKAGNIKYDYSQHHRNYAVVRLEADIENRPKPVDAAEAAPKASETAHVRLNNSETRARLHKVTAEARFHRAVTAKTMDTKKDVLCRELDALRLEDCQRKYRTAGGGPSGLAARRVNFVALNEAGKKEQFTKRFGIGDEPTFSLENAKTREYLRKEYGLGRIENESVADSIEFSRSNSPLQLNSNLERK
ncbi:hypothetical protein BDR26DRAFT_859202 [Obelidium mucronatum]|nr:hypothetical protein BDR26DRAFT_859202 [Obelidium mucronatum]